MKYPKTKEGYLLYLESDHWDILRSCVLDRDGNRCVRCGSGLRLQAHHKFYRPDWEDSVPGDLETLCRSCHEKEHPDKVSKHEADQPLPVPKSKPKPPKKRRIIPQYNSFKELQVARSMRRITKIQFLKQKMRFLKFPIYRHQEKQKMNWVSRGSSSN
jgi:hypothetical protein